MNYVYTDEDNAVQVREEEHTVSFVIFEKSKGGFQKLHFTPKEASNLAGGLTVAAMSVEERKAKEEKS